MKIVYVGTDVKKRRKYLDAKEDVLLLLFDRWDDYNYKTSFPTSCKIGSSIVDLDAIRILVENEQVTFEYLDSLLENGWDGVFPPPSKPFISIPNTLAFYEQIAGIQGLPAALDVARSLHDASLLTRIDEDSDALKLVGTRGFENSLQREQGSIKAYLDGWKLFSNQSISVQNQIFHFRTSDGQLSKLELRFTSGSILPHDINVLIGPNGIGKSQLMLQIVTDWLASPEKRSKTVGFESRPNINQLVVVSYSPFELFPLNSSSEVSRRDEDVYRYFGLRGKRRQLSATGKSDEVVLSRNIPKTDAARSLLSCLAGDQKFVAIKEWSNRLRTMEKVLKTSIDFDVAAVFVDAGIDVTEFYNDGLEDGELAVYTAVLNEGQDNQERVRYIPITDFHAPHLKLAALRKHTKLAHGIEFLKDGKKVFLSSGQRLFSYIVINILGTIRRNSLLLIDEPELFLHPTLEIAFISMLKTILHNFGSKALIATHSVVTVRETPRDCVHVLDRTDEGLFIKRPPFETFGGDVQRISSYVFGDKSVSKPFEQWLQSQLDALNGSAAALIESLGADVNEELLIQIHAMGDGKW
ncbi:ATP-binding protein [Granulicella sp. dw_53]|uniref:ATP-binding protein n=1 Tax=Granulicella sp. dw_53 TaxID=2719792 RepID=UPI001BD2A414|nr:ATP-binding protein [Granulicella sp. dw_53]